MTITHKFVDTHPDGPDATLVRPSNWNDTHSMAVAAYSVVSNNTNATADAADNQTLILGAPGYTTSGVNFAQLTINSNNFAQFSLQNTNSGSSASSDYIATADDGSDTTHYVDFGINNSTGGSTAFTNAHAGYVYSVDNEFDIGALGASGVVNVYTTGGVASPVLAATFTATQGLTVVGNIAGVGGAFTGVLSTSQAGAASAPAFSMTGTPFVGTGTTSTPLAYLNGGSAPTTWNSTASGGTYIGINAIAGFTGNFIDVRTNGGVSLFSISSGGAVTASANNQATRFIATVSGASLASYIATGALFTGGTGTTNFPQFFSQHSATAVTTWSAGGTYFGVNTDSGFTGNFLDFHVNGGSSNFSITSAGSILSAGRFTSSSAAGASVSVVQPTGALFTGGTGTTNFPQYFSQASGVAVTTWSTSGTYFGVNADSGFSGNFLDFHINGGASVASISSAGSLTLSNTILAGGTVQAPTISASGNLNAAAWTTTGRALKVAGSSYTDTTSSGTVATTAISAIQAPTLLASSATTYTNSANFYIAGPPIASTNVTQTNAWALYVASGNSFFAGDTSVSGNLVASTAGNGLQVKSGSNARIGTGTLSGGSLVVANTSVTANTRVFLQDTNAGALTNVGSLTVVTSAGVGFTVTSTNVLDTSTFNYLLVESN